MIGMNLMILSSVYTFTKASDIYFRLHSNFSRDSLNPFTLQFAKYDSRSFMNDAKRTVVIFLLDVHYFTKKQILTYIHYKKCCTTIHINNYIIHVTIHVILWISWFQKFNSLYNVSEIDLVLKFGTYFVDFSY